MSFFFLNWLMFFVDVIVFISFFVFSGVEINRNMSMGGFLRQCLRLGELNMDKIGKCRISERIDRYIQLDRQVDGYIDRQIDSRWMEGWIYYRQSKINRWMDGWMYRKIYN